jgi:hypothetical protein
MNVAAGTVNSPTPEPSGTPTPSPTPTPTPEPSPTPSPTPTPAPELDENGNPKPLVSGDPKPPEAPTEFVPLTAADITIPEGLQIADERRDQALAIINDRELSPKDQLQKLVDLQAEVAKEASEAISETWTQTQQAWQDEVKADSTIGGDKLPATLAAVNKLVTEYGDEKLVEAFAITGAGNNVHVIKFLNSVAGKLLEGGPVNAGAPTNAESSAAERLFPSMKKG